MDGTVTFDQLINAILAHAPFAILCVLLFALVIGILVYIERGNRGI